jgi:hypothetical protein
LRAGVNRLNVLRVLFGLNAPIGAAGLSPDGTYVFQVTDPSGKVLLSQDPAQCREVTVANGVITGTAGPCPHATGGTITQGSITSITVQLCTPPDPGAKPEVVGVQP